MLDTAIGVTWPIIVLNANEVIPPTLTPFRRMAVPNNSAGIAQESGPFKVTASQYHTHSLKGQRRYTYTRYEEDEIEKPCQRHKGPVRCCVRATSRVLLDDDSVDEESNTHDTSPIDLKRASSYRVNCQNADRSTCQTDHSVDSRQ